MSSLTPEIKRLLGELNTMINGKREKKIYKPESKEAKERFLKSLGK